MEYLPEIKNSISQVRKLNFWDKKIKHKDKKWHFWDEKLKLISEIKKLNFFPFF